MDSVFLMGAESLVRDSQPMRLQESLAWAEIANKFKGLYKREAAQAGGLEAYAPLSVFKLILLGQWPGPSNTLQVHALKLRLDIMVLTGVEPSDACFSCAATIYCSRNRLGSAKLDQVPLRRGNVQLEDSRLKVVPCCSTVI